MPRKTKAQRDADEKAAPKPRESKAAFIKRLHREGRFNEFKCQAAELKEQCGLSIEDAKFQLQKHYPPLEDILPGTGSTLPNQVRVNWKESDEGSFFEVLQWTMSALGKSQAGVTLKPVDSPGPRSWGIFKWAKGNTKEFYALWAKENTRVAALDESNQDTTRRDRYAVEEIDEMLEELKHPAALALAGAEA